MSEGRPSDRESASSSLSGDAHQVLCYRPDMERLWRLALKHRNIFRAAEPFRHVVFDGLFPDAILDQIVREAPERRTQRWSVWGSGSRFPEAPAGVKKGISSELAVGPVTRNFMLQLNSLAFLQFLELLTGVKGLVGDPSFQAEDCTPPGGPAGCWCMPIWSGILWESRFVK